MDDQQYRELEELYEAQLADPRFEKLREPEGIQFVPARGPLNPYIMLVGLAPGRMENASRQPFVGKAGTSLSNILIDLEMDVFQIYLTNICKFWPKDTTKYRTSTTSRELTDVEFKACTEYLRKEIEIVQPKVVGLCGKLAIESIYPEIENVYEHHAELLDGMFVPLYHPAAVFYSPNKKRLARQGYLKLKEYSIDAGAKYSE